MVLLPPLAGREALWRGCVPGGSAAVLPYHTAGPRAPSSVLCLAVALRPRPPAFPPPAVRVRVCIRVRSPFRPLACSRPTSFTFVRDVVVVLCQSTRLPGSQTYIAALGGLGYADVPHALPKPISPRPERPSFALRLL